MSFPKYAEYVDSGVEWLEASPSNWGLFLGKRLFKQRKEKAYPRDEQLAASQAFGVVPQKKMMTLTGNKVMLALGGTDTFRHVEENDFVISLRSFEGGIEHSAYTGCVSPAYTVLTSIHTIVPLFYKYLFKSRPYIAALQASTDSLRDGKSITFEQFGAIPLPNPSISEQTQIARFLDHETAKIDALIAEQKRLIKLLQEKRQAVISHAVTKGLDPNVPMKDSGVEWLGKVPSHWEVKKIKHFFTLQRGHDLASSQFKEGKYPVYGSNGVIGYHSEYTTKGPSITVGRSGSVGEVNYVSNDFWAHNTSLFLKSVRNGDMEYVYYVLLSMDLKSLAAGSAVGSLDRNNIHSRFLAIPSMSEQVDISKFLKEQLKSFDSLAEKVNENIILLKERRSALISAAVTGKIDVRDWQPPADESAFDKDVRKAGLEASA